MWREGLIIKIRKAGVNGKMLRRIKDFFIWKIYPSQSWAKRFYNYNCREWYTTRKHN